MTKKVRKLKILAFPNLPQTLPKSFQNRCSKKHANFDSFLTIFCFNLTRRNLKNINFPIVKSLILRFSSNLCFYNFLGFSVPKTYQKAFQKAFQNEVRTLQKSMPKMCRFSTSIFEGFGLDFGVSWASKLTPSWI